MITGNITLIPLMVANKPRGDSDEAAEKSPGSKSEKPHLYALFDNDDLVY